MAGNTLPADYGGCDQGDIFVGSAGIRCKDGSLLTSYDDRFYATPGGTIVAVVGEMSDDKAYAKAYAACLG